MQQRPSVAKTHNQEILEYSFHAIKYTFVWISELVNPNTSVSITVVWFTG
jgi:hypothetical protein